MTQPSSLHSRELARRTLARRRLLYFTQQMYPAYTPGWVHEDLATRLERFSAAVTAKKSPRLMLLMPPRTGKSELASVRFPAWHLGHNPTHEVVNAGYSMDLPSEFSRKVRGQLRDPFYQAIFPDAVLDPDAQGVETWKTTKGGSFTAVGVGGGLTGKGCHVLCFVGGTQVRVPGGSRPIEELRAGDLVLAFDHVSARVVPRRITALQSKLADDLYQVETSAGHRARVTADHPYFVLEKGYVPVQDLEVGDRTLRLVSVAGEVAGVRSVEEGATRDAGHVLRPSVFGRVAEALRRVSLRRELPYSEQVLFAGVPEAGRSGQTSYATVSRLWGWVSGTGGHSTALLEGMRCPNPLTEYGRHREQQLQARAELRTAVRLDVEDGPRAGPFLRGVRWLRALGGAPCRRRQSEQRAGESGSVVPFGPYEAPQVEADTVSVVRRVGGRAEWVYDITVEGCHNFFADEVLVHNCVDDPIKNIEEADNAETRKALEEWYESTAYTRLAPGGGVLLIETFWNDDDLAGRLQMKMRTVPGADQFEIVKYPAISEQFEYRRKSTFEIFRSGEALPPDDDVEELRAPNEALHPARYDLDALLRIKANMQPRIWSALYQQNPVPDEGIYFRKEYLKHTTYVPPPQGCNIYTSWDFAIGLKQQNDWTVGATIMQDDQDNVYVLEVLRFRGDSFTIVEAMIGAIERWGMIPESMYRLGVEDGQIWRSIEPLFKRRLQERRVYPSFEVMKPLTDKLARARPLQGRMQQGKLFFPAEAAWLNQATMELLRFPGGAHDDVVDALAWATRLCMQHVAPSAPPPPAVKSWRDKLNGMTGASDDVSHMAA